MLSCASSKLNTAQHTLVLCSRMCIRRCTFQRQHGKSSCTHQGRPRHSATAPSASNSVVCPLVILPALTVCYLAGPAAPCAATPCLRLGRVRKHACDRSCTATWERAWLIACQACVHRAQRSEGASFAVACTWRAGSNRCFWLRSVPGAYRPECSNAMRYITLICDIGLLCERCWSATALPHPQLPSRPIALTQSAHMRFRRW